MTSKTLTDYIYRSLSECLEKQKSYRLKLVNLYLKMIERGDDYDAADISVMFSELDKKIHRIKSMATAWPRAVEAISEEIVHRFRSKSTL